MKNLIAYLLYMLGGGCFTVGLVLIYPPLVLLALGVVMVRVGLLLEGGNT